MNQPNRNSIAVDTLNVLDKLEGGDKTFEQLVKGMSRNRLIHILSDLRREKLVATVYGKPVQYTMLRKDEE